MHDKEKKEEPKESHHVDKDTADEVLELMEEFAIEGDELVEPETKADPESSSG